MISDGGLDIRPGFQVKENIDIRTEQDEETTETTTTDSTLTEL
jgi:hypothetical protein